MLNGYLLTLASLILLGGSLGDRLGRRRIFVIGVGWFTAASLLCAIAPSAELLIGARLLQGIGGALLTPGSLAMIESSFRRADRARAIGAWSGLAGVATALGPLLGGYLVEAVSWRAIFLINVPIGAFVVVMANRHVPETRDPMATGRLDAPGAALAALGLAGTTYALIEAPGAGALAADPARRRSAGSLALVAFLVAERRSAEPDDAADDLRLTAVQRRQPRHVRRLRGARRRLLPARRVPADLARLLARRRRRRLAAGHAADAAALGPLRRARAADRAADPAHASGRS